MQKYSRYILSLLLLVVIVAAAYFSYSYIGGSKKSALSPKSGVEYSGPKYGKVIESMNPKYYTDTYFHDCFVEKITSCEKNHKVGTQVSLSGSFLESVNGFLKISGNEGFDNCVGDSINTCYALSIERSLAQSSDIEACQSYVDPVLKQNCLNDNYPKMAIAKDNIEICNKNTEAYWLNYCRDAFNQAKSVKNRDISLCEKLSESSVAKLCKDNYYFSVALETGDISFCNNAGDKLAISNCTQNYVSQSRNRNNKEDCQKIQSYSGLLDKQEIISTYNRCVMEEINAELMTLDPKKDMAKYKEICAKMPDKMMQKDCIRRTESEKAPNMSGSLTPVEVPADQIGSLTGLVTPAPIESENTPVSLSGGVRIPSVVSSGRTLVPTK